MKKININKNWRVWQEEDAFALVFAVPQNAKIVDLPYDALFTTLQKEDSTNQGKTGFIDGGVFNYYKVLDQLDHTRRYEIVLDSLAIHGSVYVNGSLVAQNDNPYVKVRANLTPYLRFDGHDELLVKATCPDLTSRYYVGGGLCRNAYLLESGGIYVDEDSVKQTTLHIHEHGVQVSVSADIKNTNMQSSNAQISITIENESDKVLDIHYPICTKGESTYHFYKTFYLENVMLWDDMHPHLYKTTVTITTIDESDTTSILSGFRKIAADPVNGLTINHKKVKLRGACIHHDQGILGASTYDDYELYRIKKLKDAGFNAIRSAHNPASPALLKACDQLGMYVMDEALDVWFKSKSAFDYSVQFESGYPALLTAMVESDYNHPCVILYSTGNEISQINTQKGFEISNHMSQILHELDDSRLVTNAINGAFAIGNDLIEAASDLTKQDKAYFQDGDINKFMRIFESSMPELAKHEKITKVLEKLDSTMDVLGYNYMTSRYSGDIEKNPQRLIVGSETYPKQIAENWENVMMYPQVLGDFTWTGFDYLGEVKVYPSLINTSGDISFLGQRRPISYYRELVFGLTQQPCIAVRSPQNTSKPRQFGPWKMTDAVIAWDFPGQENQMTSVEIYANAQEVELFCNGKSLGRKKHGIDDPFLSEYQVPYQPGKLEVIAYSNHEEVGRAWLKTPSEVNQISTQCMKYDQLTMIEIRLEDENQQLVHAAQGSMKIELEDMSQLLAFASEDTQYHAGFRMNEISIRGGVALAIIHSSYHGNVMLSFGDVHLELKM